MNRLKISELPEIERERFTNAYEAPDNLIKALKSRCEYVDMLWDPYMEKMVLFEIQPWSDTLVDIAYYEYNKLGLYIADTLHGRTESNKNWLYKRREMREAKRQKDLAETKDRFAKQCKEDKEIWRDFDDAMNSKGNIHKHCHENKLWYPFLSSPDPTHAFGNIGEIK